MDAEIEKIVAENFKGLDELIEDEDLRFFYRGLIETCIEGYNEPLQSDLAQAKKEIEQCKGLANIQHKRWTDRNESLQLELQTSQENVKRLREGVKELSAHIPVKDVRDYCKSLLTATETEKGIISYCVCDKGWAMELIGKKCNDCNKEIKEPF